MKTISSRFLKGAVAVLLAVLMVFGTTLTGFAAVVDKAETGSVNHTGGYIYFLKPSTWTESKVMMFVGHNSYTDVYEMTKVSNTDNLYRYTMGSWGGATYVAFANASSVWGGGNWGPSNRTNAPHYTNVYNEYRYDSGKYYVHVPASTSNNCNLSINYKSSTSAVNLTTAATAYYAAAGSSTYTKGTTGGTSTAKGYYLSSATAVSSRTAGASVTLAPGTTATFTASPASGYVFKGWSTTTNESGIVSTSTTYTHKYDISYSGKTLYALFKAEPKYSVTYDANGGTDAPADDTDLAAGSSHTVSSTVPTYTGYNFKGWNTAANGTGASYTAGQTITVNDNITLYAQWAKVHTITYNANGGSGAPDDDSVEDGQNYTIPATTPTKANYNFTGWKDQNDATYAAGATISAVSSNMTLTAQWELAGVCSPEMAGLTLEINETGTVEATTNEFCTGDEITGEKTFTYSLVDGGEYITLDGQTVTPKKPGTAHIMATCSCGETVTCAVTVKEPVLDINPEEVALLIGQSMTEAFVASANVGNPSVTFTSKDTSIATVTNGKATAVAEGNVDIEASLKFNDYYTDTICAKVSVSTPEITAAPTSVALEFGEGATATSKTVTLTTNAVKGNGTGDTITVTSDNASVATAAVSGTTLTINAAGVGSTTVKATFHGTTVEIPVTVTKYDPYFTIYLTNNKSYSTPNLWYWDDNQNGNGVNMVYIGKNGSSQSIFAYRFLKTEIPDNIIFRDGEWKAQTNDIDLESLRTTDNNITADSAAFSLDGNNSPYTAKSWAIDIKLPTVSVADVVVPVGGNETATATVTNGGKVLWKSQGTTIATIADVDTQTSTVTGVTPGETTITARAFVDTANSSIKTLPTNYKTDTACWDYISTEATATVTVGSVDYTVAVNAETGGTASITVGGVDKGASASIAHGTEYTLTATANNGYRFLGWYAGEDEVSTEASYTTTAKAAITYTAKFKKTYTVSVIIGEGIDFIRYNNVQYNENFDNLTVDEGAEITVYASPSTNYAFTNWTDANDSPVSSNPTYTINNVSGNIELTANAVPVYTASATAQTNKYFGTYGGTVKIDGQSSPVQYKDGETVTFQASPNTNYYFDGWYSDAEFTSRVSSDANYQTTMTEDGVTLYGLFVKQFYLTSSADEKLATFVYNVAENSYSVTADFTDHFTITSNDNNDVTSADVNVTGGTHTGCTVAGHYTSYQVTPDTDNYDIESPVTYTLTPDLGSNGVADGTYTMNIALSDAEKVEISVDGTKVADKAIGSTFTYEITPPDGQYLSGATITPNTPFEIIDGKIKFTVPNTNVNIVPAFTNYSYVELSDSTGITATGLKTGYKVGEAVEITLSPSSEATTITNVVADFNGAVITQNGDNWTVTIDSMPADTTITLTTTVDAKFMMDYAMSAIGNYGTGVTTGFGTVSMKIGDTALAKGGYADKTEAVTYTANESNANYTFAGFYSDADCENVLSYEYTYTVTPTKDTTVYTLWARRQYMDFDSGDTNNIVKELVYDKEERVYTLSTVLADNSSTNAISKGAWFQVTNDTNSWTADPSYHHFGSDFSVSHNANGFDATISWNDGGNSWKLSTSAANDTAIKFILTPTGNTAIDFSAQVGEVGDLVYLSSGRLDLPGSYNAEVFEANIKYTHIEESDNPEDTYVANEGENREKYKRLSLDEAQTVSFEVEITGTRAADYEVNSFVVYHIDTETYTIITPTKLGNNKYSGSVYVDGPCYIVPIYFLTEKYAADNNLAEIDIYFDATAIKDKAWGPFVACYAWGSNNAEYHGGWSGQMMIPDETGETFYTMLTVPKAGATGAPSIPNGVTFNNYTQSTVPGSNPGAFGISATQYQCYDYREPITLYEAGYDVITFVAKDSTDGYHGDRANGVTANTVTSSTTDIFNKYDFDYLYSRDGETPMDFNGDEIENPVDLSVAKADYYVITKGDITYDPNGTKYVGDANFDADWAVDWYVFDSTGKYLNKILSTAMWHDKDNNLDELYTYLHEALGTSEAGVAGKTVAISYEHENNAGHQISYDGQWYGNYLDDTVNAQVKVGFQTGENQFTINPDTENPHIADYGEGYLDDLNGGLFQTLDVNLDYGSVDLHAVRKDGYSFIGWFTQKADGTYHMISSAFDYHTYISMNETYYAMFREIAEGEVIINHSTYINNDPAIPSHDGISEMSIIVTDNKDGTVYNCTPSTSRTSVAFEGIEGHTYTVKIITTPLLNGEFFAWYTDSEKADGTKTYEEILTDDSVIGLKSKVEAEFVYEYTLTSQKVINIYSDVKRVSNTATITYKYLNRFGDPRNYVVKNVPLTDEECLGFPGNEGNAYVPAYLTAYTFMDLNTNKEVVVYGDDRYNEYASDSNNYQYVGAYNKVQYYAPNAEVTEVYNGTVNWVVTDEANITTESALVTFWANQDDVQFTIHYTMPDVNNDLALRTFTESGEYDTLLHILAPAKNKEGQKFSYWYDETHDEILAYTLTYNYRLTDNRDIIAVYGVDDLDEWTPTIESITKTREFGDNGDYIYTDYHLAFTSRYGKQLNEVYESDKIEYGLLVVRDSKYFIENDSDVVYPDLSSASTQDYLKRVAGEKRKNMAIPVGNTKYNCYYFDLTGESLTNFNRCDYYLKYNNDTIVTGDKYFRDCAFTAVAYVAIDKDGDGVAETVYLSKPKTVNFFELGNKDTDTITDN